MKLRRPPFSTLAFALPATAVPLLLVLASFLALHAPEPVRLPPEEGAAEELVPPEPPEKRVYVSLFNPVTVSLPASPRMLKLELGLALRADTVGRLITLFQDNPEQVEAGAADALLRIAEVLGPDADPSDLRAAVPDALREEMNARLIEMGEEPAVLEVLITNWALSQ